jgi:restriction system protein
MPIPDYQALMLPLLQALTDGKEHALQAVREEVAAKLKLSEENRQELLPSGKQAVYDNRLGWAKTFMDKAGLMRSVKRGVYQLTDRGRSVLASKPSHLDVEFLEQFPEFKEFYKRRADPAPVEGQEQPRSLARTLRAPEALDPLEALDAAYQQLRRKVEDELLQSVKEASFRFFERLVVELLVKMGYGGSLKDAGKAIGRSGDDGLDGVIKEDHLGLDAIYVQAKRWQDTTVGRPEVQAFAGSLEGVRGRKGVFITTSQFSSEAREYVSRIEKKIVLIDGPQLASLMTDFGIGVTQVNTYEVKRVDTDFFSEE